MLYLLLAILSSAAVSIVMRLSTDKIKNNIGLLAVSYMVSTGLAAAYTDFTGFDQPGLGLAAAMALVNGSLFVAGFVIMQRSIPQSGVVLTSTFMRLGLIVCLLLSVLLFREMPTALQVVGFALAVFAILLSGGRSKDSKFGPMLLLLLIINGVIDTWAKVFGTWANQALSDHYLMLTFLVAAVLCLGLMLHKKQRVGLWELLFGAAIAIPNYYCSRFLLLALRELPGIVVYPTFGVATLLTITALGICLFRERLSRRQWISMGIILVALALLNL